MTNLSDLIGGAPIPAYLGSFKNKIINGNFDIWQRGTSGFTTSDKYTADRWFTNWNGDGGTREISRQAFTIGQTNVPNEPTYFCRIAQSVAATSQTYNSFVQRIEDVRTFAGKIITLSFYAKALALETIPYIYLSQDFGSGGSSSVSTVFTTNAIFGTSWTKYTYTVTVPSISGKTLGTNHTLILIFSLPINETFQIDIAQVQLEEGLSATNFEMRHIGQELALCQRYFIKLASNYYIPRGYNTEGYLNLLFPVKMRATPTANYSTTADNPHFAFTSEGICGYVIDDWTGSPALSSGAEFDAEL
jgi:hypothetical protein